MLNVNDFNLIPLSELVHDQALFDSYMDFIGAVGEIYDIEDLSRKGEIDLSRGYIYEDDVLYIEAAYWKDKSNDKNAKTFIDWSNRGSRVGNFMLNDSFTAANVLVNSETSQVLGRSTLVSCVFDDGVRIGYGFDIIHPDYREQGLGKVILAHRMAEAKELGVEQMKINVALDNVGSLRRLWKLKAANLIQSIEPAKHSDVEDNREIAWFKADLSLEQAYEVLSKPLEREPEPMEYYFEPC